MNLTFVYDHVFIKYRDQIYSSGAFSLNLWNRYLSFFDSITVVAYCRPISDEDINQLNLVSHSNVQFKFLTSEVAFTSILKRFVYTNNELKEILRDSDKVIIRMWSEIGKQASRICNRLKIKYGVEVVGCPFDAYWNHSNIFGKPYAVFNLIRMKYVIYFSPSVLYVTELFLQRRYPTKGKTHAVSDVIIDETYEEFMLNRIARRRVGDKLVIGMIAGLDVKGKGHDTALKALKLLQEKNYNFEFLIVGQGNGNNLRELIKMNNLAEKVNIIGKLKPGKEILEFLSSLDIFILPSRQEGLPRSIIEAMSTGCPVVASNIAGIPELIPNEYLHKVFDFRRVFHLIESLSLDSTKFEDISRINLHNSLRFHADFLDHKRREFWSEI